MNNNVKNQQTKRRIKRQIKKREKRRQHCPFFWKASFFKVFMKSLFRFHKKELENFCLSIVVMTTMKMYRLQFRFVTVRLVHTEQLT